MTAKPDLKPAQRKLLQALAHWRGPELPSARNLAAELGFKDESGIRYYFRQLREAGLLEMQMHNGGKLALPRLTESGRALLGIADAEPPQEVELLPFLHPVAVFPIACGPLMAADPETERHIEAVQLFEYWDYDRDYLLRGEGESMFDVTRPRDTIFDGDFVHVRRGIAPANGEIVHAEYRRPDGSHECTLKQFRLEGDTVYLEPFNPAYETIVLPASEVEIRGVVMGWITRHSRWGRHK